MTDHDAQRVWKMTDPRIGKSWLKREYLGPGEVESLALMGIRCEPISMAEARAWLDEQHAIHDRWHEWRSMSKSRSRGFDPRWKDRRASEYCQGYQAVKVHQKGENK